jgi:hypothetical protein
VDGHAVSLTGQLTGGELGRWCAANLTGAAALADEVTAAVAGVRPVRPAARVDDAEHWATVGGAFGVRLAFATQHAPPYYALLGAHRASLVIAADVYASTRPPLPFPLLPHLPSPMHRRRTAHRTRTPGRARGSASAVWRRDSMSSSRPTLPSSWGWWNGCGRGW